MHFVQSLVLVPPAKICQVELIGKLLKPNTLVQTDGLNKHQNRFQTFLFFGFYFFFCNKYHSNQNNDTLKNHLFIFPTQAVLTPLTLFDFHCKLLAVPHDS